ncbi:minor capsid protein VP2 [Scotophilus kuhlii polyomavirus 2]|nr:minor capsid protein VP2 [Scotophilus kuhlii polyomavirus 2]
MGGILTLLVGAAEALAELTAVSGLTAEALLTGEALAALEAEVASLSVIEGISGIEALEMLGFTAEQFSNMTLIAGLYEQGIAYGALFQTMSGASALLGAGIKLAMGQTPDSQRRFLEGIDSPLVHSLMSYPLDPLHYAESMRTEVGPVSLNPMLATLMEHSRWVVRNINYTGLSGQGIEFPTTNAGTHQVNSPDWMLPLVLGLSGDTTENLRIIQNGS